MTTRVSLLGAGTVGGGLLELLKARELDVQMGAVLVRDARKARPPHVPRDKLTTDPEAALAKADVVVELLGGTTLAGELIVRALEAGKRVVTANKAVLAERWRDLLPFVREGRLYFEAAVMAGTPVIGPLTGALQGSNLTELHAILNGTCNFIVGKLEAGESFETALAEAQRLGYAEADPSTDIDGVDAAHKLTVLARLVCDPDLSWQAVREGTRGLRALTPALVRGALERERKVRLVASLYPVAGKWRTAVRPVYLPASHPLAAAESHHNALLYRGDAVGEVFIRGPGAGALPTASAVLADLLAAIHERPGPQGVARAVPPPATEGEAFEEVEG